MGGDDPGDCKLTQAALAENYPVKWSFSRGSTTKGDWNICSVNGIIKYALPIPPVGHVKISARIE
jgi:hypothetical protein